MLQQRKMRRNRKILFQAELLYSDYCHRPLLWFSFVCFYHLNEICLLH